MITHRDILRFELLLPDVDLYKIIAFYQVDEDDDKLEKRLMSPKIFLKQGEIFLGLQKIDGKCVFLEENNCKIYDFRPPICRSFPYTFQIRGDELFWGYTGKGKDYCPGINESKTEKKELEQLASFMLEESKEFQQLITIWNHLAKNKLVDPTPELFLQFITGKIKLSLEQFKD